jgi:two-component system NtrC family response regulator
MGNVLIIDDDEKMCKAISTLIKRMGHDATCAFTLSDGLEKSQSENFDVVFLNALLPDGNGLDLLPNIKKTNSTPEVIIIAASGDPDNAEVAIRSGAWAYIEKTSSIKEMLLPLARAFQYRQEKQSKTLPVDLKRERIIGSSPTMKICFDLLAQASASNANVLLTGETGTGKELFAQAIHFNRPRTNENIIAHAILDKVSKIDRNFVVVDCTALPETLVESVLFGHEKGAFTGADRTKEGLVKQADGGTLFLDEVGELPLTIQKAFLRVLHERRFRPVGGKEEKESNFRLISATNRNLDQMVEEGEFRKDLLFRLRSLTIELPPLRERREDIQDLTRFHMARLCNRYGIETKGISPDFFETVISHNWPGNVRELVNILDGSLAAAGSDPTLFSQHLPIHLRVRMARDSVSQENIAQISAKEGAKSAEALPNLRDLRQSIEIKYFHDLIFNTGGDVKKSCQLSGLSRSRLYELLAKYNISMSQA